MLRGSISTALVLLLSLAGSHALAQGIRQLEGHDQPVTALAFRPDGQRMASASFDRTIKVWEVPSGRVVRTLAGHAGKVLALAWRPDGQVLASAALDGTIRLWAADGSCQGVLHSRERCLQGLAFSPDGLSLVSAGENGFVEVWDAHAMQRVATLRPAKCALYCVAYAPDGRCIAAGGQDGCVRLVDLDGVVRQELDGHGEPVYSVAFAPGGQELASGGGDRAVRRWQVSTGRALGCLEGHEEPVYQVGYSSDGRRLVSAGTEGQVIVWDSSSGLALHGHRFPARTLCAAFTPDGRQVGTGTCQASCYLLDLPRRVR